ncbi:MAG: hypothetical protein KAS73_05355 [Candidatus Sabulitectum sp.]|nr:hypothetical protein [Candidatus Sabulitectum sp.]
MTNLKELVIRGTLAEEVRISSELISTGIKLIQEEHYYNEAIDVPLILLANGLERLLKCIFCFYTLENTGKLPTMTAIKKDFNHNIAKLFEYVFSHCYSDDFIGKGTTQKDLYFFRTNPVFQGLVKVINDFALRDRYANLDLILYEDLPKSSNPDDAWGKWIELVLMQEYPEMQQLSITDNKEFRRRSSRYIAASLNRLMYSFVHLMILGKIGEYANTSAGPLKKFRSYNPVHSEKEWFCK